MTSQKRGLRGCLGEIVGRELEAALGDFGEIVGAAGVENGARQVRVPA